MTVRGYAEVLWRRKWVIVMTFAIVVIVAVAATLLTTPMYNASTTLRVLSVSGGGSADWVAYDMRQLERLINTYAETATSRPALTELAERLGLRGLPPGERPDIQVELVPGTELMKVITEAPDPLVARDAANTLAEILIAQSQALFLGTGKTAQEILGDQLGQANAELNQAWVDYETLIGNSPGDADRIAAAGRSIELKEETYTTLLEQYERNRVRQAVLANTLSVVEEAVAPGSPSKPRVELNLALGLMVGLAGGIGLAFLLENLDTALYSTDQIKRAAELPILGLIPVGGRREQVGVFDGNSLQGEAFRRLRTNLFSLDRTEAVQSVLVTSAEPQEGKSTVTANLGFSVAQSGRKVVVVDAHLRLPVMHRAFGVANRVGLSSVLEGKATLGEAIQRDEESGVDVLTSGPLPPNPAELVSSPQMSGLLEELVRQYDMVLLDTPSFLAVTDAAAIAPTADGVVLVVGRAQAHQGSVRAASQQLSEVGANPLGVVVNRAEEDGMFDYYQRIVA